MFIPYSRQSIQQDDIDAVTAALRSDFLTTGPRIAEFETAFAQYVGAKHGIATSNGTSTLHIASQALGVGPTSIAFVPNITFLATANAPLYCGAKVVLVDVDPSTAAMDYASFERAVKLNVDSAEHLVLYPVHFGGLPMDLKPFRDLLLKTKRRFTIIEDAAHAAGASDSEGTFVGACKHSDAASFSFHAVKGMTTGEGGMVTTNSDQAASLMRNYRSHGMVRESSQWENLENGLEGSQTAPWYYEEQHLGNNYRITDFQAALGLSQLKKLDGFISRRRELASNYDRLFSTLAADEMKPLFKERSGENAFHLYPLEIDFKRLGKTRTEVFLNLRENEIGVQVHYIPLDIQPYFQKSDRVHAFETTHSHSFYASTLSIPLYPTMTEADQKHVFTALSKLVTSR
jgi:UDP-4-amino-4,6-dideoxy-N-acetyl-beta-L-altrosamine transaminase